MRPLLNKLSHIKYTIAYTAMIPLINVLLPLLPLFDLGHGAKFTPVSLIVGFIYILRDFAQNEIGRKRIFLAMGVAGCLTYMLASPAQAIASLIAFFCGELSDWAVYSFMKRPLSERILVSSLVAVPVDVLVVLTGWQIAMPGFMTFNAANVFIMISSNMLSAVIVFFIVRRRERRASLTA